MDYRKTIKELREKMFLSQAEFANRIGTSFATVNRWENGHHVPTYKARRQILALCKKYGIVLDKSEDNKNG